MPLDNVYIEKQKENESDQFAQCLIMYKALVPSIMT